MLIENNLIKTISSSEIAAGENAARIDGGGRTLMPGLIDSHVHLLYSSTPDSIPGREAMRWDQLAAIGVVSAREFLADGFTTVRDAGAMYDGIKKVIDQGLLDGPRIYPSGGVLSQTSGHADWRAISQRQPAIAGVQDNNLGRLGLMHLVDGVDEVMRATSAKPFPGSYPDQDDHRGRYFIHPGPIAHKAVFSRGRSKRQCVQRRTGTPMWLVPRIHR